METANDFFVWLFEEMIFECIRQGKEKIDLTFSCQEQIARLPNKTFKWIHEVDGRIGDLDTFEVKTLVFSPAFQQKARETLAFWAYNCEVGMKDMVGLRCYIKATRKSNGLSKHAQVY